MNAITWRRRRSRRRSGRFRPGDLIKYNPYETCPDCEGWGLSALDSHSGGVFSEKETYCCTGPLGLGTVTIPARSNAILAQFSTDGTGSGWWTPGSFAHSKVVIGGEYVVSHIFHPSASLNLYQIDVVVAYRPVNGSPISPPVTYRRVVDWDVPPDPQHQVSTWGHLPGTRDDYVVALTNGNLVNPDPSTQAASNGAVGYFADFPSATAAD
jgi:hypothetical protein